MEKTKNNDAQAKKPILRDETSYTYNSIGNILQDSPIRDMEGVMKRSNWSGIPSEYQELDKITNGWKRGELTVIAGRPSIGKTSFLLSMVGNLCLINDIPTGFISLEMGMNQFLYRLFSIYSCVPLYKIINNEVDEEDRELLHGAIMDISKSPLYVDCSPTLTISQVRDRAIDMLTKHGIKLLIIDYLQLLRCDNNGTCNQYEEMSIITHRLKSLAKELNIPILVSSQLRRKPVSRDTYDYTISLSELRDSGTIDEDADIVCFIERPEVDRIYSDIKGNNLRNKAVVTVAKNRSGETGELILHYFNDVGRFYCGLY